MTAAPSRPEHARTAAKRDGARAGASVAALNLPAVPRVLWRLTRQGWTTYPKACAFALATAFASTAANLATPHLLGKAVDLAHGLAGSTPEVAARTQQALVATAFWIVVACALRSTLAALQGFCGEWLAQRVGQDLRLAFYDKLQRLSFADHDRYHSGDLLARGMLDLEGVRGFRESGVLRSITLLLLLGLGIWRLFSVDPMLAALALTFVPFVLWRAVRMGVWLRVSWQRLQECMSDMTLGMEENLQGQRVVRAFAARLRELARFDAVSARALSMTLERIRIRLGSNAAINLAYYASMGLVLWAGGARVAAGTLTPGALSEVLTFMTLLRMPLHGVGMIVNAAARAGGAGTRLFEILDMRPAIAEAPGARDCVPGDGVLRVEGVSFAYPSQPDRLVLRDVSLELRPGQVLGVVGAPGSGKSTLGALLARHHDPVAGRITLGGQDLRSLRLRSLRRQVTTVPQEAFVFDASVHDNVAYAEPELDRGGVEQAARTAQLHAQAQRLPDGYDSRVGERGVALSGGQRQRLTIARGLVPERRIVILDDSASALDTLTERALREALRPALADRALVVIAHRLSAVRDADQIIVLDHGRIVERGRHEDLLRTGGLYAQLWVLQHGAAGDGGDVPAPGAPDPTVEDAA
ncbi:ABC transporter ATP-binding protein [Xylophilus sp.]|uniref:ABC transporter ATP-binding protein n=1 Tax=Xylophilus sp. TaxID=2653893 RepID=UPI0013B8C545|nr:ABC transporter ATP-binding protein [Xylophilus sp.]KAF1047542.1 MAG: putative multidrug export ATP-binding/permease protein [Xylophilus sp.]